MGIKVVVKRLRGLLVVTTIIAILIAILLIAGLPSVVGNLNANAPAVTVVQTSTGNSAAGVTSLTTSFSSGTTAHNAIVVFAWGSDSTLYKNLKASDDAGNVYKVLVSEPGPVGTDVWSAILLATDITASSSPVVTVSNDNKGRLNCAAQELSNISTTQPCNSIQGFGASPMKCPTLNVMTTHNNAYIGAVVAMDAGSTCDPGVPKNFTNIYEQQNGTNYTVGECCYQIISASGTYTVSWNCKCGNWAANAVVLCGPDN